MTAVDRPASAVEARTVVHAYGVVPLGAVPVTDLPGVRGAPVVLVEGRRVAALASELPVEELGEQVWREHAEDPQWLGEVAREHHAVLQALVEEIDVLPLRLPALWSTRAALVEALDSQPAWESALRRIAGHVEWGLQAYAVPAPDQPAERPSSGAAYLRGRADEATRKEEERKVRAAAVLDLHEELALAATHAVTNPPQDPALSGRDMPMVLNAAYLVPREGRDAFLALADRLHEQVSARGLVVEVSGPWPAYNFVDLAEAAEEPS